MFCKIRMDFVSPERSMEESSYKEPGALFAGELDLNLLENKDYQGEETSRHENDVVDGNMLVESNLESPVASDGTQFSVMKHDSLSPTSPSKKDENTCFLIKSNMQNDDAEGRISEHNIEAMGSMSEDYDTHSRKQEADDAALSGELLDSSDNTTLNIQGEPRSSSSHFVEPTLLVDDSNCCSDIIDNGDHDHKGAKPPSLDVTENKSLMKALGTPQAEEADSDNEEMNDGSFGHHDEMKEDNYPLEKVPSGSGGMEIESSDPHSYLQAQNGSPSPERQLIFSAERSPKVQDSTPSPERQLSVLVERSPRTKLSEKEVPSSPTDSEGKARSQTPVEKHSHSPEKHSVGRKRASSRERSSPPVRRKSPPGNAKHRDSRHRDDSPRHLSPSPRRQESPRKRIDDSPRRLSASPRRRESPRRRIRPASRSPLRKDSSRYGRDQRARSRSRSPYARDHYRRSSPRRRNSPRRRSPPPSYSRRRSPRRPWSPPANRNTGVGRPGKNLFVAGFSYVTTERDLERKFSRFGRVTDVRIVRDKRSGDSRGFGFLSLERDEDADAAIRALDQTEWNGRIVLVEKSKTSAR
ncbi:uncharacterized protein [Typha latifolia]|uniref:uncharacterized protein isoform X1 n=2 Tax=Typha latifolia TaxID=4733 RepID=UPI003C2CFE93